MEASMKSEFRMVLRRQTPEKSAANGRQTCHVRTTFAFCRHRSGSVRRDDLQLDRVIERQARRRLDPHQQAAAGELFVVIPHQLGGAMVMHAKTHGTSPYHSRRR